MEIRKAEQLEAVDALIIPGGESTTMAKLAHYHNLVSPFPHFDCYICYHGSRCISVYAYNVNKFGFCNWLFGSPGDSQIGDGERCFVYTGGIRTKSKGANRRFKSRKANLSLKFVDSKFLV